MEKIVGLYKIFDDGTIIKLAHEQTVKSKNGVDFKRVKKEAVIKQMIRKDGYVMVSINSKKQLLHRVIASTFLKNDENKAQINHIDGDKTNNNVNNLEWVTSRENIHHAIETGLTRLNDGVKQRKRCRVLYKPQNIYYEFDSQKSAAIYFGLNISYFNILKKYKNSESSKYRLEML